MIRGMIRKVDNCDSMVRNSIFRSMSFLFELLIMNDTVEIARVSIMRQRH